MAMVPAVCTQCGGKILIDDTHEAGICQYCGTPFITEKAINIYQTTINIDNATINVVDVDIDNLLLRAKRFEEEGNWDKAAEYYNEVLDHDISNVEATKGLKRLQKRDQKSRVILLVAVLFLIIILLRACVSSLF